MARSVARGGSLLPLVVEGQCLNESHIQRLARHDVSGVYIRSKDFDDLEAQEFLDPAFKHATVAELKKIFTSLNTRTGISRTMYHSISNTVESLVKYVLGKGECLFSMIDLKDYDAYTYTHSMDVGILSALIGLRLDLGKNELAELTMCGLLHDCGKLDIPLDIVNKPARLTPQEYALMQTHPSQAVRHLRPCCQISARVLDGIATHHERFDGTGYPSKVSGDSIPLFGRILSIADVYDALTSERSYRTSWSSSNAIDYIAELAGKQFDPHLTETFLTVVAAYPVGALVSLSNGHIAVVLRNNTECGTRPLVRVVAPLESRGLELDLHNDRTSKSLRILGLAASDTTLPDGLF